MVWSGLGDVVKWSTDLFGLVPCDNYRRRQRWLNRLIPFRRKTLHEKMFEAQNRLWGIEQMSKTHSALLVVRHRDAVEEFRSLSEHIEGLRSHGDAAFHILFIKKNTLHCALVPPIQGDRFSISRRSRRQIKSHMEVLIKDRTRFEKVIWYA